ncbi:MAG: hypothetical protein H6828_08025 [Planctomycetes bacterium]|nr:hypothetical protein [Planctomycetota bacterium]
MRASSLLSTLPLLLAAPLTAQTSDSAAPDATHATWLRPVPVTRSAAALPAGAQSLASGALGLAGDVRFVDLQVPPEGDMPRELCFTPDGNTVVVANRDSDTLTFVDFATQQVTHAVTVGDFPVDVAVTPDGMTAVSADVFSDAISVVDVASHALLAQVPITGSQPFSVEVTPDSQYAIVAVINDAVTSSFSVVDLSSLTEVRVIPSASQGVLGFFGTTEFAISGYLYTKWALTPDGSTIVLPDRTSGQVFLYDVASGLQVAALATGGQPTSVDVSADGTLAVVAHEDGTGTLSVIDLVAKTISATHVTGQAFTAQSVRVSPDKTQAVAAISNNVVFVDLATGAVTATVNTGTVGDLEVTADGQSVVVSNFNTRVISFATHAVTATLSVAATAELAVSPVSARAAGLNNRFREDVHLYDTAGSGAVVAKLGSGPPPEVDAPRPVAISADGATAVVGHGLSSTLSVVDLVTETVRATLPTGERVLDAAITPDGSTAVVLGTDTDRVTIVDLDTDSVATELVLGSRPSKVVLSPDSQRAYVAAMAGSDRIWFVNLAGAASASAGSLVTGQMGSSFGYSNSEFSGIALSPDGAVLAVCESFDDNLRLVDALGQSTLAVVPVGDFPIRARFSPDGARCFSISTFGDDLRRVDVNGAASSLTGTTAGIDLPATVDVDPSGAWVYVGSYSSTAGGLYVVDANSMVLSAVLPVGRVREARLAPAENALYLLLEDPSAPVYEVARVALAGASSSVTDLYALDSLGLGLDVSSALHKVVVSLPALEGVDVIDTAAWSTYCVATPNSAGPGAEMSATGSTSVLANDFGLRCDGAIPNNVGLFYYGLNAVQVPFGNGVRCVGGTTFRLGPPQVANGAGTALRAVDNALPPASSGAGAFAAGSTFHFQYWYRDPAAGGAAFNLSDGLTATFVP